MKSSFLCSLDFHVIKFLLKGTVCILNQSWVSESTSDAGASVVGAALACLISLHLCSFQSVVERGYELGLFEMRIVIGVFSCCTDGLNMSFRDGSDQIITLILTNHGFELIIKDHWNWV